MRLSIITINRNNAAGLDRTMRSVLTQTYKDFEYVVVDGASTDESVDVIKGIASKFGARLKWVSEPDSGIYNAMNKGIKMARGEYIQILNSGDCLASEDVTEKMLAELELHGNPMILYGNMIKCFLDGHQVVDKCFAGQDISMLGMFIGTLNHDPVYICKNLFEKYGYYDEGLRVVSDWKWFTQAIIFGSEKPQYVDINVTLFDMTGISETNLGFRNEEKRNELERLLPPAILTDYTTWADGIDMLKRLKRHHWAFRIVWFIERCLFKLEKQKARKNRVQIYQ